MLAVLTVSIVTASPAAALAEECSPWFVVPSGDTHNEGYLNDRHGQVWAELQSCTDGSGMPAQWYGRVIYNQYSPNTAPYQSAGLRLRLYDLADGCYGCDVLFKTPRIPEPGPGTSITGERVPLYAGGYFGVDVAVYFVNPPNPLYFQTGTFTFYAPV